MTDITWQFVLRAIAVISWLVAIAWFVFEPGFEPLLAFLTGAATFIASFFVSDRPTTPQSLPAGVQLYDPDCGNESIDLGQQRLLVSTAFGTYFAGLLERENSYTLLKGQVEAPARKGLEGLGPIQRIFWEYQYPRGARVLVIAGEGGMGKSTLATKIIRCLFREQAIDMILGDSAKSQEVGPVSGKVVQTGAGYYDVTSFYERVGNQLGLPSAGDGNRDTLTAIGDRLTGRRAIIVVDNLETLAEGDRLIRSLQDLTNRDVRAIVTTRKLGVWNQSADSFVVHLNPLNDLSVARQFLAWHIEKYQDKHPALAKLRPDLEDDRRLRTLIERTGGIPLLMQLTFSDVARLSWKHLDALPDLFGDDLLVFLYEARWRELKDLGEVGLMARQLLRFVANKQYQGETVTFERLSEWAQEAGKSALLTSGLALLNERFLIINQDPEKGNFAVFPSLAAFLERQT